jgi:hypothetical protein
MYFRTCLRIIKVKLYHQLKFYCIIRTYSCQDKVGNILTPKLVFLYYMIVVICVNDS